MKLTVVFLSTFLINLTLYSQSICYENSEGEYWPFDSKEKHIISSKGKYLLKYIKDSVEFDNQYYVTRIKKDKDGKIVKSYFRNENGSVYYYNEKSNSKSLILPSNIKKGEKWESADKKWRYKIKDLNATLETPYCKLKDLLEIENFNKESKKRYQSFYKKGVGFVGLNIEGKPFSFIEPNGKIEQSNFTAIGCENIEDEKQRKICTNKKIIDFIKSNLKNPTPESHGKVLYEIIIDTKGKVDKVKVKKSEGVSKQQINSGLKTLKNLPRFIPGYSGEKPVRVIFSIPLNF